MEVFTNQVYVFEKVLNVFDSYFPDLIHVFSPDIEWERTILDAKVLRVRGVPKSLNEIPCIGWNRQAIQVTEYLQDRGRYTTYGYEPDDEYAQVQKALYGSITMGFIYITNNIMDIDTFELGYSIGVSPVGKIEVDFPTINGSIEYVVDWEPISDIRFEKEESIKFYVTFEAKVTGIWLICTGVDIPRLKNFNTRTVEVYGEYVEKTIEI